MDQPLPGWRTLATDNPSAPAQHAAMGDQARWTLSVSPTVIAVGAVTVAGIAFVLIAAVLALAPEARPLVPDGDQGVAHVAGIGLEALGGSSGAGTTAVPADAGRAPIVVDVEGAVRRPGIVELPAGSRLADALRLAGGFSPRADLAAAAARLNLAQPLEDGAKILVPEIGSPPLAASFVPNDAAEPGPGPGLIDLNHADQAALETLPGIGPVIAGKIIEARGEAPFTSVDELRSRGIVGEATFTRLRDLVTVGP